MIERLATGGEIVKNSGSIPDKIYFKIGEVSEIVGVEPYVLRYWESEFHALKPTKSNTKQRLYQKRDVELLLRIKKLLHDDLYTIAGAKKQLAMKMEKASTAQMALELATPDRSDLMKKIESELLEILKFVDEPRSQK